MLHHFEQHVVLQYSFGSQIFFVLSVSERSIFVLTLDDLGCHSRPKMAEFVSTSHPQSYNSTNSRIFKHTETMISLSTTLPHFRLAFQKSGPPRIVRNMCLNNLGVPNNPNQTFPGTRFDFCAFPIRPDLPILDSARHAEAFESKTG
jgi:hypothetical protein